MSIESRVATTPERPSKGSTRGLESVHGESEALEQDVVSASALAACRAALADLPVARRLRMLAILLQEAAGDLPAPVAPQLPTTIVPGLYTDLTGRQRDIFVWISEFIARNGISPSLREIGKGCDVGSTNGVNDHVRALLRKGYLVKVGANGSVLSRSLRVADRGSR